MKGISVITIACFLQLGCQLMGTTKVELAQEEVEAQRLIDAGVDFRFSSTGDGKPFTTGCGIVTAHTYRSSDGVEVAAPKTVCMREDEAAACFEDRAKDTQEVFKKEVILDAEETPIGKRLIGVKTNKEYIVTLLRGKTCLSLYSSSLRHLLAFEEWSKRRSTL